MSEGTVQPHVPADLVPAATPQELYDRVCTHLTTQGRRSLHRGQCLYRTPATVSHEVLSCAVGCQIPDSVYSRNFEGKMLHDLLRKYADDLEKYFPTPEIRSVASALQCLHDSDDNWDHYGDPKTDRGLSASGRQGMRKIATQFNLVPFGSEVKAGQS